MNFQKTNIYLSTLLFVLIVVGYQLVTTLFLPVTSVSDSSESQLVTVPYRALVLVLCIVLILINIRYSLGKLPLPIKFFWFFWIILIIRIFYDTNIRTDVHIKDISQVWIYIFGIILPLIIVLPKIFVYIDFYKSLILIFVFASITLVITLFNSQLEYVQDVSDIRYDANIALNTISYGHLGTTVAVLGIFIIRRYNLDYFLKILVIILSVVGLYSILRAGSRGPFIAFFGVLFFWYISRMKNALKVLFFLIVCVFILSLFADYLFDMIGFFSPLMEERLKMSFYEGDTSERNPLYYAAIKLFMESPIIGKQFAIFEPVGFFEGYESFAYAHNMILDAFMGLGIVGGFVLVYILYVSIKIIIFNISSGFENYWISLILLQSIISSMFSGAIYYDPLLSGLLVLHFCMYYAERNKQEIIIA